MRSRTSNPVFLALLLAVCLSLSGCASLLERSYSVVEPYTDRYRDSGGEDALRAESYQDLVNSLMMLVEQRAEEGTIRCYEEANSYILARRARQEVRQDTTLGAYLLDGLNFTYEGEEGYCTLTCHMSYREDAEDLGSVMTISDSQSLVDLLRLAVREELEKLTVRFVNDTSQTDVTAAIDALWQELCRGEEKTEPPLDEALSQTPEVPEADARPPFGADDASLENASWTTRLQKRTAPPPTRPFSRKRERTWTALNRKSRQSRNILPALGRFGFIPIWRPPRLWKSCWAPHK